MRIAVAQKLKIGSIVLFALIAGNALVSCELSAQEDNAAIDKMFDDLFRELDEESRGQFKKMLKGAQIDDVFPDGRIPQSPSADSDQSDPWGSFFERIEVRPRRNLLRDRRPSSNEKQSKAQLTLFKEVTQSASPSTVTIRDDRGPRVLGTIVGANGWIISKASEIDNPEDLSCRIHTGQEFDIKLLREDSANDIALLKIEATGLTPIQWSSEPLKLGSLVVTGDRTGTPLAMGVVSVNVRSLVANNQAFLGVGLQPAARGVVIETVVPNGAAAAAGLMLGDIVLSLDSIEINSVNDLVYEIRRHNPGDRVKVTYIRDGKETEVEAVLGGRNLTGIQALQYDVMNRAGTQKSRRHNEFPAVFQHDSPLWPEQCGGPLLNLDGKAVGINIARGGRVESFALPPEVIKQFVSGLLLDL